MCGFGRLSFIGFRRQDCLSMETFQFYLENLIVSQLLLFQIILALPDDEWLILHNLRESIKQIN